MTYMKNALIFFNIETFKISEFKQCDFEQNIDPDKNFFGEIQNKCNYFTDKQFSECFSKENNLSVIHFNARSIKANFEKISSYIYEFKQIFDIVAISETWLTSDSDLNMYQLEGYDMFHINRTEKKGGGVALFTKKYLKCKVLKDLSVCNDMFEIISVEISVEKS